MVPALHQGLVAPGCRNNPLSVPLNRNFRRPRFLRGEGEGAESSGGVGGAFAQGSEVAISWETDGAQSRSEKTAAGPRYFRLLQLLGNQTANQASSRQLVLFLSSSSSLRLTPVSCVSLHLCSRAHQSAEATVARADVSVCIWCERRTARNGLTLNTLFTQCQLRQYRVTQRGQHNLSCCHISTMALICQPTAGSIPLKLIISAGPYTVQLFDQRGHGVGDGVGCDQKIVPQVPSRACDKKMGK
ncbi:hypothetical protein F7725_019874 [Dissostichus mawsoni]|uniref:Uncharacterized protein n=1 Tax=Dissostichus mawsoni TaxID=36200 RepID=A0A7J5YL25_DISMA|nr:hypothetical protein F7725_019874 [Dissostichus mawsoni]